MLVVRTSVMGEEILINFDEKAITKGGKKYNLVYVSKIGIGFTLEALVYDSYYKNNLYLHSEGTITNMFSK